MTCTNKTILRRRRIIAAALSVPLSLGMVSAAYATGPAEEPRGASESASLRVAGADKELPAKAEAAKAAAVEKADLRVADAAPAADSKAATNAAAEKKAEKAGAAAGAVSGQSAAAATTNTSYVNGNANSSKADRPNAPVSGPTPTQPLSNADKNGTGANPGAECKHSYCSNGTGLPTGNGVGDGKAVGQPCAGCVGKADNKNPKGQAPDGSDHNAGYECDRNQGIGKTNPAHTGCTPSTTPPTTPPVKDACPDMEGTQAPGTDCDEDEDDDACPKMDGDQAPGTECDNGNGGGGGGNDDITFCHATGSSSNPYEVITTAKAAAANGHYDVDHQGGRDIIPAFTYGGRTFAAQGNQALLGTGCVKGGTTVDVCPNMTGDQPVGTDCDPKVDVCPNMTGDQPVGTDCGGGGTVDVCPDIMGNQPAGTDCGGGGTTDVCPNMDGNQPVGTLCNNGGGGGGGPVISDNCPDMDGFQVPNTVCTVGTPIAGTPPGQGASGPLPGVVPGVVPGIVPNTVNPPAVIGGTTVVPAARPQARAVPSALPFTGTDAALLAELGVLLLVGGAGVAMVARRERLARAA